MQTLHISSSFDGGAIEVVSLADHRHIALRIRADSAASFAQWFYFALHGAQGLPVTLHFANAGACSYPKGWQDYRVVASLDRKHWFRIDTTFDGEVMSAHTTPQSQCIYFAYFEPYSWERHLDLLASVSSSKHVLQERLGATLEGRDMSLLRITDAHSATQDAQKRKVWLIARQHPGETMAHWFVEGFLQRLLEPSDALARVLLQRCIFHVVPHMNPDGAVHGNLRTNAAGANLNREWLEPSMERSPEVYLVRQKMLQAGVDLCLDAHGDECLPYNFVVGSEGNPGYTQDIAMLETAFKDCWMAACPDFQDTHHYGYDAPGQANPTLATNWVAQHFGCLALTIEMPFKDNAEHPDAAVGWSGARARQLGASVLLPLLDWTRRS